MTTFARGRYAVGICARSGRKMLLRNMVADGYYPDLMVDPQWREPRDPQEEFVSVDDPVALEHPQPYVPDTSTITLSYPLYDVESGQYIGTAVPDIETYLPDIDQPDEDTAGVLIDDMGSPITDSDGNDILTP